jgi:hypothetical protein
MRVGFETESGKKHGVPRLRGTLDYRNILRSNGAHHILRDGPARGRYHLLRGCERKLTPRVSNARRSEHVEIDLCVRRTVLAAVSAVTPLTHLPVRVAVTNERRIVGSIQRPNYYNSIT